MDNQPVVEHAERVLLSALTRWQLHGTGAAGEDIVSVLIDDLFRNLLGFTIESVVRVPPIHVGVRTDEAARIQPIKHAFAARVTIDVCDRPTDELRRLGIEWNPVGSQSFCRLYYVRQYADDRWMVLLANDE